MIRKTSDMYWQRAEPAAINDGALYLVMLDFAHFARNKVIMGGYTIRACLQGKSPKPKWMARIVDPETNGT